MQVGKPAIHPVGLAGVNRLIVVHNAQFSGLCVWVKFNPGLLQNPRLYFFVMNTQQVEWTDGVVLFSRCAGLVSHDLRYHPHRHL